MGLEGPGGPRSSSFRPPPKELDRPGRSSVGVVAQARRSGSVRAPEQERRSKRGEPEITEVTPPAQSPLLTEALKQNEATVAKEEAQLQRTVEAVPVAARIGELLAKQNMRSIDLVKMWDKSGCGKISRCSSECFVLRVRHAAQSVSCSEECASEPDSQ